ncbi:MAG: efflux transporter periplasmic adaptor subunit [Cytophagaceae bacterium SCN 52-12]|nr:MAG: efflux transporter periplasmic adaptor subunit [Cytophagaceae bacterium SCN 52-12]
MLRQAIILPVVLVLAACGGSKKEGLEAKKEELANLKTQQTEIGQQIKALEAEIAKLDTTRKAESRVKLVTVSPLQPREFKRYIELQGTVDAKNSVMVTPKTPGAVTAMYVKEGDFVNVGSTIAKIDDSILRESIEELKTQLALVNTLFEKQESLWNQKIGTEIQYLQAKNNKEALEKKLVTLQAQLSQSNITSPIAGTVDLVNIRIGEMAQPGLGVVRVVNLSNLKVVAKIADSYVASVKKGDEVIVKFPDLQREYTARISFVGTTVDPLSRTFMIEANLPATKDLKPNMMAQVQVNDATRKDALVVDQNLVQNTEKGKVVFVAVARGNEKVAEAKVVETGLSYNGKIEILSGLTAGDMLITQGYQEVVDGQAVSY